MARTGMLNAIKQLRLMTDTAVNEVAINDVWYWSDDQLQDILDRHARYVDDVALFATPITDDGVTTYTKYFFKNYLGSWFDEDTIVVVNNRGTIAPTNAIDYKGKQVTFVANTLGYDYFIRGRVLNMNAAAAEVWQRKADHRTQLIDWKDGTHTLNEDQEYQHILERIQHYQGGGIKTVQLMRSGYAPRDWHY